MTVENIDGTPSGTGLFNTKMPGYDDPADIQAALRTYHYGSTTYDPTNTNPANLPPQSIANYLHSLTAEVDALQLSGIGSDYAATAPTTPQDGFIWVNSASPATTINSTLRGLYQDSAPTSAEVTLVDGLLWVDKNSTPLKMYVYDATITTWREIGA
jgi:hypothetical protein